VVIGPIRVLVFICHECISSFYELGVFCFLVSKMDDFVSDFSVKFTLYFFNYLLDLVAQM